MNEEEITEAVSEDDKFIILKARFKSNALNFYGLLLLIFNNRRDIEVCHSIISTYSSLYENEPHINWQNYQEIIVNAKWKGNYNPSMSSSIQDLFNKLNSDKLAREQLYDFLKNYEHDEIDIFLFDIINKIIHDKNLILETGIQEVTASEYRATKDSPAKKDEPEEARPKGDEGAVTLPIKLILAPVSGKPIYELKVGDKIMTKIVPNSDRANYYIDLLDLRVEDRIKPIPADVIEIKSLSRDEPLEILVQLGPGIYGTCMEDERQVKLRMYDPSIDGAFLKGRGKGHGHVAIDSTESLADDIDQGIPKVTFIIGGILMVILIMLIVFILYM